MAGTIRHLTPAQELARVWNRRVRNIDHAPRWELPWLDAQLEEAGERLSGGSRPERMKGLLEVAMTYLHEDRIGVPVQPEDERAVAVMFGLDDRYRLHDSAELWAEAIREHPDPLLKNKRHAGDWRRKQFATVALAVEAARANGYVAAGPVYRFSGKPFALPEPPRIFRGRDAELLELEDILLGGSVCITGAPGFGKTGLALVWAAANWRDFPDGALFVPAGAHGANGARGVQDLLLRVIQAFGIEASSLRGPDDLVVVYRSLLAQEKLLLIFDDVPDTPEVSALLPGLGDSRVICTARESPSPQVNPGSPWELRLGEIDADSALGLLTSWLGTDRAQNEPEATQSLLAECAGMPLALTLLGATVRAAPKKRLSTVVQELAASRPLTDYDLSADGSIKLRTVIDWSLDQLGTEELAVIHQLACFPTATMSRIVNERLMADSFARRQIDPDSQAQALTLARAVWRSLLRRNLLTHIGGDSASMHDLIRRRLMERLPSFVPEELGPGAATSFEMSTKSAVVEVHLQLVLVAIRHTETQTMEDYLPGEPADKAEVIALGEDWIGAQIENTLTCLRWCFEQRVASPFVVLVAVSQHVYLWNLRMGSVRFRFLQLGIDLFHIMGAVKPEDAADPYLNDLIAGAIQVELHEDLRMQLLTLGVLRWNPAFTKRLAEELSEVRGVRAATTTPPSIGIGGQGSLDQPEAERLAEIVERLLRGEADAILQPHSDWSPLAEMQEIQRIVSWAALTERNARRFDRALATVEAGLDLLQRRLRDAIDGSLEEELLPSQFARAVALADAGELAAAVDQVERVMATAARKPRRYDYSVLERWRSRWEAQASGV